MKTIELIKASAGSGKTHELMNRLSRKIAEGVKPEALLATTFTVKAAAELKSRIRQQLLLENKPEMASQVFDGLIGTVNSVCGQLLSEYAIEGGLSPDLDVLPEENADMIFAAAIHSVMKDAPAELESVAARLELTPLKKSAHGQTRDWQTDLRQIVNFARSNAIDKAGLEQCAESSCSALKEVFPACTDLSLETIARALAPYQDFPARGQDTAKAVNAIREFLRFPTWYRAVAVANSKYAKTKDPSFPIGLLRKIGEDLLKSRELYADMEKMIRGVFKCAAEAVEAYAEYKKALGLVDFIDQESRVLELLNTNADFCKLLCERIEQIMVDEFQDTSPIQLALFLKLNDYSKKGSVWVGDPKQAIYGFRGTDPELMEAVAARLPMPAVLKNSWRSKKNLVKFSNEVFKRIFSRIPEDEVVLGIPAKREKEAAGGQIEAWHIKGKNAAERAAALASGVVDLIRNREVAPGDICVLFWSNFECASFAAALKECNISATVPAGELLDKLECQLVMAAYRYCIDNSDTAALATLTALYGEEPGWLNSLAREREKQLSLPESERRDFDRFAVLRKAPWLEKLVKPENATPLEILEHVIAALSLDRKIAVMGDPEEQLSNLDELRRVCNEYMEQALVNRTAATPGGFVAMLTASRKSAAAGIGRNTVNVMTYHKSKGLEFPVVILGSLNAEGKNDLFDIMVRQAEKFDISAPLAGRSIHYWPWPFGMAKNIPGLDAALIDNPLQKRIFEREREELKRLFYVGLTRAKEHLIFAMEKNTKEGLHINWLRSLSEEDLFLFPTNENTPMDEMKIGDETFKIETRIFDAPWSPERIESHFPYEDPSESRSHAPAKKNPSSESCAGEASLLTQWDYFTGRINRAEGKYSDLGSAFHDYIALNPAENGKEYAQRLLENYGVKDAVEPAILVECCQNLYNWLNATYSGAKISCEVPMTYHNAEGTLYQGFIDMLLELPEGFVIIDHKTHPAAHDAEKYAAGCAGQLQIYRQAVEGATGKKVLQTIIHLPNLGRCYEVKPTDSTVLSESNEKDFQGAGQ